MKRLLLLLLALVPGICYGDSDLLWSYRIGSGVWTVDMSSEGEYIAVGTFTSTAAGYGHGVYLFDESGKLLWDYDTTDVVWSVSINDNGEYIAAGSKDKNIYLFNRAGELLWKYEAEDTVWSVSISSDGEYIAAGSYDNHIYLFDKTGVLQWKYKTDDIVLVLQWKYKTDDIVLSTSISSDGEYIAAGSYDNQLYYFDRAGSLLWKYRTNNVLFATSISSKGEYIAAGSYDNSVYLFDRFGNPMFQYETDDEVWGVSISKDGSYVAAASKDSNVYFFSSVGDLLGKYKTGGFVSSVSISQDGDHAVAGSYDRSVSFFRITPISPIGRKAPELEVIKTAEDSSLRPGEETRVYVELKNIGASNAKLVEFSDELPEGFTLVEGELSYITELGIEESKTFSYVIRAPGEIKERIEVELPKLDVSYIDIAGNQYTSQSPVRFLTVVPRTSYIPVYTIRYRLGAILVSILELVPGGAPVSNINDIREKLGSTLSSVIKLAFLAVAALVLFIIIKGGITGRKTRRKVDKAQILMKIRKEFGAAESSNLKEPVISPSRGIQKAQIPPATKREKSRFKLFSSGKSTTRRKRTELLNSIKNEVRDRPVEARPEVIQKKPKKKSLFGKLSKIGKGRSAKGNERKKLLNNIKNEVRDRPVEARPEVIQKKHEKKSLWGMIQGIGRGKAPTRKEKIDLLKNLKEEVRK
jgi:uncharacterized repeat protein (TIGR01451 family)